MMICIILWITTGKLWITGDNMGINQPVLRIK
jgi:hypothetical protein